MKKGAAVWNVKSNSLTAVSFCLNWGNLRTVLPKMYLGGKRQGSMQKSCLLPSMSTESIPLHQSWYHNRVRMSKYGSEGLWSLLGDEHSFPTVRGVPWKGLHIRLMLHPTAHRNSVLSISVTSLARNSIILLWRSTCSHPKPTSPWAAWEEHPGQGSSGVSSPQEEALHLHPMPQSFSWCAWVDWGSYTTWSRDSGPKTCLSGPNSSPPLFILLLPLWAKITPPSCSKSKFQLLIKKKKKAQKLKWPNLFGSLFRGRRLRIQATFL